MSKLSQTLSLWTSKKVKGRERKSLTKAREERDEREKRLK